MLSHWLIQCHVAVYLNSNVNISTVSSPVVDSADSVDGKTVLVLVVSSVQE